MGKSFLLFLFSILIGLSLCTTPLSVSLNNESLQLIANETNYDCSSMTPMAILENNSTLSLSNYTITICENTTSFVVVDSELILDQVTLSGISLAKFVIECRGDSVVTISSSTINRLNLSESFMSLSSSCSLKLEDSLFDFNFFGQYGFYLNRTSSSVEISGTSFSYNEAKEFFRSVFSNQEVFITEFTFSNNKGKLLDVLESSLVLQISGSNFFNNTNFTNFIDVSDSSANIFLSDSNFLHNIGSDIFGLFYGSGNFSASSCIFTSNNLTISILLTLESEYDVKIDSTLFEKNQASLGGLLFYDSIYTDATLENITVREQSSNGDGLVYFWGQYAYSRGSLSIRNINITNSFHTYGAITSVYFGILDKLDIDGVYAKSNIGIESGLIDVSSSEITAVNIRNVESFNYKVSGGSLIAYSRSKVDRSDIQNITIVASNGSSIYISRSEMVEFYLSNSSFSGCYERGMSVILNSGFPVFDIRNIKVVGNNLTEQAFFYISTTNLTVENLEMKSNSGPLMNFYDSEATLTGISFEANEGSEPVVLATLCGKFEAKDLTFNNNKQQTLLEVVESTCQLENTRFSSNSARSIGFSLSNSNCITKNMEFFSHSGSAVVLKEKTNAVFENIDFYNCTNNFLLPGGIGVPLVSTESLSGNITFNHTTFRSNRVLNSALVSIEFLDGQIFFEDLSFENNQGGALSAVGFGLTEIKTCLLKNNTFNSQNPLLEVLGSSVITLSDCEIVDNNHLSIFKNSNELLIQNTKILNNLVKSNIFQGVLGSATFDSVEIMQKGPIESGSCFIVGKSSDFFLYNSFVANCASLSGSGGIAAEESSSVLIDGCDFYNSEGMSASVIESKGKLEVKNSNFFNSVSKVANGVLNINGLAAKANIMGCNFENSQGNTGGSVIAASNFAEVNLTDCTITNGSSVLDGSCILVSSAKIRLTNITITGCITPRNGGALSLNGRVSALIEDSLFINNSAKEGGTILLQNMIDGRVEFQRSKFENNRGDNGGVISFSYDSTNEVIFEECRFNGNEAKFYGGIYLSDQQSYFKFTNSHFENNVALSGGIGYQDWDSKSSFFNCTLASNFAYESGGSFYLDKSSSIEFESSTCSKSSTQGSGGVFLMSLRSSSSIINSYFEENFASIDGGVIYSIPNSNCEATIQNSTAFNNTVGGRGGFADFDLGKDNSFNVTNLICHFNSASYGGCFSFEDISFLPNLQNVQYENNSALTFGNDVNSPPNSLEISVDKFEIFSGDEIPLINAKLLTSTGEFYYLPLPQNFLLILDFNNRTVASSSNLKIFGLVQQDIEEGTASFSKPGNKIRITGEPGKYELYIGPRKNDLVYNPLRFGQVIQVEIKACPEQGFSVVDLVCKKVECFECSSQNGVCVSANNCSCLNNFEGLRCDLKAGAFETLDILFETLPAINKKRSQTITVEMRDFILQEITKSVGGNVTVEYRRFFETENGFVFRVALIQNGDYLEGDELAQYRIIIQDHFSQYFGITPELSQQEAVAEILEYNEPVVVAALALTFIMVAVNIGFMIFIFLKRDTPVIKASSPLFCMLILIGILLSYLTILPYIGTQNRFKCAVQPIIAPLSFSIIFGNLLAKTFRIYRIFGNRKLRKVAPTNKTLLSYSGIVIGIEMFLVILWLSIDAPKPVIKGPKDQRYWTCESTNPDVGNAMTALLFISSGILLAIGVFLAVATRKAYSVYKESQLIGFSVYGIAIVAVAVVPVIYSTPLNAAALFALRSFAVIFISSFTLLILFTPKLYVIVKNLEINTSQNNSSTNGISLLTSKKSMDAVSEANLTFSGKLYIKEEGAFFSRWEEKYGALFQDNFGIYDDDKRNTGLGMFPITAFQILKSETNDFGFVLIHGKKRYQVDCQKEEDLRKWASYLSASQQASTNMATSTNMSLSLRPGETI